MPEKRNKYDPEFRQGAVQIVRETGKSIAAVARDLGINPGTLGNWVNKDKIVAGAGGNVVATGFEPKITSMSISCIFAAGSAAVGTAGSQAAPLIVVSAAWERVIQCALGGTSTAITTQSEFGDAWEALMGCAGGIFTARIDRS